MQQTINLSKSQPRINLSKSAPNGLSKLLLGVNWGMIKGFLGRKKAVDLDASIAVFAGGTLLDTISFMKLKNAYIAHSGDDRDGDDEDDGKDNETITIDFNAIDSRATHMFLFVNSFSNDNLDELPYAGVRIYEGQVDEPTTVLAKFELANSAEFKGAKGAILGACHRDNGEWQFDAIGTPVKHTRIEPTVEQIKSLYNLV